MTPARLRHILASLLVLGAVTAPPLHAQAVGFHLGASRATMQFDPEPPANVTLEPRYGLTVGLAADFTFSRSVGLSLRGSYSQKGLRSQGLVQGGTAEAAIDADYAELTALLTARPGGGPFRLLAGPAIAFNGKCTISVTGSLGGVTISGSGDCEDEEYGGAEISTDLGLTIGAGLTFGSTIRYSLDALYTLGLSDALAYEGEGNPARHRTATLVAGVSFPLGR